jgi:hypothetical protein
MLGKQTPMIQRQISTLLQDNFFQRLLLCRKRLLLVYTFFLFLSTRTTSNEWVPVSFFGLAGFCGGIFLARFFKKWRPGPSKRVLHGNTGIDVEDYHIRNKLMNIHPVVYYVEDIFLDALKLAKIPVCSFQFNEKANVVNSPCQCWTKLRHIKNYSHWNYFSHIGKHPYF